MKIKVNNEVFEVIDEGNKCDSALLLIQGLGCDAGVIWRPVINELKFLDENKRIVSFNVRGIGKTSGWPDSLEQMADDAARIIEKLGIRKVKAVGHSLGGAIAILLSSRHPNLVDSLVLISSIPAYSQRSRSGFSWRANLIREAKSVSIIFEKVMPKSFCQKTHDLNPKLIEKFKEMLDSQDPNIYAHICDLAARIDAWPALKKVKVPISVVVGSFDPSTTPELLKEFANSVRASFFEIPDAGHNPPLEQPKLIAQTILN